MTREALLARTLVELADTLVDDFDIVEVLTTLSHRCVEVLNISAAGILLVASDGELRTITSSSEAAQVVELLELQAWEGPSLDCYRTGQPVATRDLATDGRWSQFAAVALDAGFRAVEAWPLRLRRRVIGALNLFRADPSSLPDIDAHAAQALADIATIAILQHRDVFELHIIDERLRYALDSRVVIEQAKGMIAEYEEVEMEQAFSRLRLHARNHDRQLIDVATDILDGRLGPGGLDTASA